MLIRSQDKKFFVNIDNVIIETLGDKIICYSPSDLVSESYITLGRYSTEKKAGKVSDMIHGVYAEHEMIKNVFDGIGCSLLSKSEKQTFDNLKGKIKKLSVFQMPDDWSV